MVLAVHVEGAAEDQHAPTQVTGELQFGAVERCTAEAQGSPAGRAGIPGGQQSVVERIDHPK